MKKFIIISALLCSLLFVPIFVSAQTASTSEQLTQQLIQVLTQLIAQLQQQINQILALQQSSKNTTPASAATSAATTSNTISATPVVAQTDYSTYGSVPFELYYSDTGAYLNKAISMIGMVNAFMPKGGSGGNTNFIEIINPADPSQPQIMLEVDDPSIYTATVTSLQDKSSPILQFIQAYGTASQSQSMTATSILGNTTVMVPIIKVTRVDKCLHGSMGTTILMGSSLSDVFQCTDWMTITPQ